MCSSWRAENACTDVLTLLKKSNLHFVLKETPFSAQIIIKKKLIKPLQSNKNIQNIQNNEVRKKHNINQDHKQKFQLLENELLNLKNSYRILSSTFQKQEQLTNEKESKLEKAEKENLDLKKEIEKYHSEQRNTSQNLKNERQKLKDKCDIVDILECTLVNKDLEIQKYKTILENEIQKHNHVDYPIKQNEMLDLSSLKVDFKKCKDEGLLSGYQSLQQCEDCLQIVSTQDFKKHFCQIELKNPDFDNLSTKKFVDIMRCSSVFDHKKQTEIAFLHCEDCWSLNSYCEKLPTWFFGEPLRDRDGHLHLRMKNFVNNSEFQWLEFNEQISNTIISRLIYL